MLRWRNGDELPGKLISASEGRLTWQSPILTRPVTLDLHYLDTIRAPRPAGREKEGGDQPPGPMRFDLAGGDLLFGELIGISDQHVRIRSPRHGEQSFRRSWVKNIMRIDGADPVDLTRGDEGAWRSLDRVWKIRQPELADWKRSESGDVSTNVAGARLYLPIDLPARCDIELIFEWQGTPAFTFAYGTMDELKKRRGALELETWGDELVVQTAARPDDFEPLGTLTSDKKTLRVRLLWDRREGRLAVYGEDAHLMAEMAGTSSPTALAAGEREPGAGGLLLENRGNDLTVRMLRVGNWDSRQRPQPVRDQDRIRTFDGAEFYGVITRMEDDALVIESADGQMARVPKEMIAEMVVHRGGVAPKSSFESALTPRDVLGPQAAFCNLLYYDGTQVHGELVSVRDEVAQFKTAYSDEPVSASLGGMREFKLSDAAGDRGQPARGGASANRERVRPGTPAPYLLELGEHRLHGTLAPAGSALGWRPVGSEDVIPLVTPDSSRPIFETARITRLDGPLPKPPANQGRIIVGGHDEAGDSLDLVHLQNGDQVPCRVKAIDENVVQIGDCVGDAVFIPREEIKAIEFGSALVAPLSGFRDRRWQIVTRQANAVDMSDHRLALRGPADLNHPELMRSGGFEIDLQWKQDAQTILNIYFFTQNNSRKSNLPRLQINLQGQLVQAHAISGGRAQSHVLSLQGKEEEPKRFGFFADEEELKFFVDGALVCSLPLAGSARNGSGVSISCNFGTLAGVRRVRVLNVDGRVMRQLVEGPAPAAPNQEADDFLLEVSNLRVGRAAGLFRQLSLGKDAAEHFLIIPRSRRHNPPKHALVALNGDLLRGELIALGVSSAQFRSGFEDIAVPRDRLAGIVWLSAEELSADEEGGELPAEGPGDVAQAPDRAVSEDGCVQASFVDGSVLTLRVDSVNADTIIARHPQLGTCQVSLDSIDELRFGSAEGAEATLVFSGWTLIHAKEPVIPGAAAPEGEFGTYSTLLGQDAEDFTLTLLDGRRFRLRDHKDKIVVLDFWATWCGPCVQAFPQLLGALEGFSPDDVLFVAVNQQENQAAIEGFLESHGWGFQVALDRDGEVARKYQVDGIPQTVVIGKGGKIEHVNLGVHPNLESGLKAALEKLIAGGEAPESDDD